MKRKRITIKSKWSDDDILAKLTELDFIKTIFSNETNSQKNKKTSTDNNDIVLSDKDIKIKGSKTTS